MASQRASISLLSHSWPCVHLARNGDDALAVLKQHPISLVISYPAALACLCYDLLVLFAKSLPQLVVSSPSVLTCPPLISKAAMVGPINQSRFSLSIEIRGD